MSEFLTDAAWGVGVSTVAADGTVLDAWFTRLGLGEAPTGVAAPEALATGPAGTTTRGIAVTIKSLEDEPVDTADVYLRLHLLSHRFVIPHSINLSGIFGLLPNNAWTNFGPLPAADVNAARLKLRQAGQTLEVKSLDKFPPMADYVTPSGVRIADASRVRLGAHLASGTTVMHEGFVNYNAGTLGNSMVEGRISAGVVVGDGSDIGGGSSIMGTLSGGGKEVISIGERCLLGANAGIGISLGDNCVVAAGCYVTAGSKVSTPDGTVVKAATLSGKDNLQFWTNTQTGVLEVRPRSGSWGELNTALHSAQ
ncbi:DapH/DapD/GlmU-related protein [Glycomyces buryatensis]|uniref:2,3,4,5-tetrahydropyridine-2,6-dicarboxylate N-succinyltransferase n=1 Tax=Glycomyces buryatensis TaxID=2570927 RepID=A0A4S8QK12_9ACTN|nr:DapH/DapD/GlmU-related protein [Glycomyces buryatensis]THV41084.1 2,3,4,5-tetrahydropyridine-2,6-dicarboxylate N-succinyltransferase [Glycomyces buryatensis]